MDEFMNCLRHMLEQKFPGATSVSVFLNAQEFTITPNYHGELRGTSMQKIDGSWCTSRE